MAQMSPETKKAIKKTLLKVAFFFGLVTGILSSKAPSIESAGNAYAALFPEEINGDIPVAQDVVPAKA